ncbi:MAG TPA: ATP-binding cassette domain-containing protein [Tepidiformaceae bacterium]|nr:ATP-binding cassette domain-containing protein [Tepidiformaceae bacterium]
MLGVVGPNGAGKTTLLRAITGAEPPDSGRIELPRGADSPRAPELWRTAADRARHAGSRRSEPPHPR